MSTITVPELVTIVRNNLDSGKSDLGNLSTADIKRLIVESVLLIHISSDGQDVTTLMNPYGFNDHWETMNSALNWAAIILDADSSSPFLTDFMEKIEQENDAETSSAILTLFLSVALVRLAKEAEAFDVEMANLLGSTS